MVLSMPFFSKFCWTCKGPDIIFAAANNPTKGTTAAVIEPAFLNPTFGAEISESAGPYVTLLVSNRKLSPFDPF